MSHRASMVVLLLGIIVMARLLLEGRLTNAMKALTGSGGSSSPGTSSGGGGSAAGSSTSSGGSVASLFVSGNPPFTGYGESVSPTVAQADQAGLTAFGGGTLAHDYDYGATAGTLIHLPGGGAQEYQYLGDQTGGWGNLYGFAAPGGGVIELAHVEGYTPPAKGTLVPGGSGVGQVGAGPYDSTFWRGPHLAVIVDQMANSFLNQLSLGGGKAQ